jgi:hypothetical protein
LVACLALVVGGSTADAKTKIIKGKSKTVPANEQATQKLPCPSGMQVVGGGAYTDGATLEDEVAESAPYDSRDDGKKPDDGWRAAINAGPSEQQMHAYAVCSDSLKLTYKSRPAGPASGGGGYGESPCPNGTKAVGGGMTVKGNNTNAPLKNSRPILDGGAWASMSIFMMSPETEGVAYSICADSDKIQHVTDGAMQASQTQLEVVVSCPEGTRVIGGGGGGGSFDSLELASLNPEDGDDDNSKSDDGWAVWTNNESNDAASAAVSAYAVCLG